MGRRWHLRRCDLESAAHQWTTERLLIRPLTPADETEYFASIDEEAIYWNGFSEQTLTGSRVQIATDALPRLRQCPLWFALCDRGTGAMIGSFQIYFESDDRRTPSLGWWLSAEGRGRGLGRDSLASMLGYVHVHLGFRLTRMGTDAHNDRARAQIEACGAEYAGTTDRQLPNGEMITSIWYDDFVDDVGKRRLPGG